ncbi:uncharacterized protein LOC142558057 [Dermacentor variabilis]|uniref:uncharacterized protein LOC142558057 n=1 Tax=Dermacentor variabilis TaxID=34621 RepID=UPI003F5B2A10
MKASCALTVVLLGGCLWANNVNDQQKHLNDLFGNIMKNRFPLSDMYFTIRPDGEPNTSTLYRFNLTNGKIHNIGHLLEPKYNNETCNAELTQSDFTARCRFNLKDAAISYEGQMLYGRPVVQEFMLYALITEFIWGRHRNPALLFMFIYHQLGCNGGMGDIRQCQITDFMLSATTFPMFTSFNFTPFRNNATLAGIVWEDFQVKMFTHVRLKVMRTINYTCRQKLSERKITNSMLSNNS